MVAQRGGHQHGACLDFSDSAVHGGEISRCGCVKWAALRFAAVRYFDSNALQQIGKAFGAPQSMIEPGLTSMELWRPRFTLDARFSEWTATAGMTSTARVCETRKSLRNPFSLADWKHKVPASITFYHVVTWSSPATKL
jgi:hypothetical protein